jgi:hypothetical protein
MEGLVFICWLDEAVEVDNDLEEADELIPFKEQVR